MMVLGCGTPRRANAFWIAMTERKTFYFDNNATTRVAPEVVEAMLPFLRDFWGRGEIVFTSCGTESNNAVVCNGPDRK